MKIRTKYSPVIWMLCLVVLGIGWFTFFSHFSNWGDIAFHSAVARYWMKDGVDYADISVYSHVLTYPFYHIVVGVLYKVLRLQQGAVVAFVLTSSNVVSVMLFRKLFALVSDKQASYIGDFCSLGIMIFMPICSALTDYRIYARQSGPNPLHNPTIIFVRPYGIAASIFFGLFIQQFLKESTQVKWKYLIGFAVMSLLSVLAKPSYAIVFLPAMGILVLVIMIRNKSVCCGVLSFAAVLPTLVVLIAQFLFVNEESTEVAMHVQFGGFSEFSFLEILAVSVSTFPVVLILIHKKSFSLKESWVLTAMMTLMIGWGQMFFLSDGGDGNFSWGYDLAVSYATLVVIAYECRHMNRKDAGCEWRSRIQCLRTAIAALCFLAQILSGAIYIVRVAFTGQYWI